MSKIRAAITSVHAFLPDYALTNSEIEKMVDTNDEWILSRTGIKERRILKGEGLASSDMGAEAVKGLCAKRGISPSEIDMVICATATPDMLFPATANIICDKIGAVNAFGYDLMAACSGFLYALVTGSQYPATHATVDAKEHFLYQEGQTVFKFAVTKMADVSAEIMERNQLVADDIAWLVPHQANKRIIDATAKRTGISSDKVMVNIEKYGNTTNGTIPICLWEWEKKLKKGDNLILAAFGGGFTWGSVYLKWAY